MREFTSEEEYKSLRATVLAARGFSAVFWSLPVAVVLTIRATMSEWASQMDVLVSIAAYILMFYGLILIGRLPTQQEKSRWKGAHWRSIYLCFLSIGLSPFSLFWNRQPESSFFELNVLLHAFAVVGFIMCYNKTLARLNVQVIDPGLRGEVEFLSRFNRGSLVTVAFLAFAYLGALEALVPDELREPTNRRFTPLVLTGALMTMILPISMTMNLTWKFKDAVFSWIYQERLAPSPFGKLVEGSDSESGSDEEPSEPWA